MEHENILITGGAGYIGSHTAHLLSEKKYNITIADDLSSGLTEACPDTADLQIVDILDTTALSRILKQKKIHAIIHFAGKIKVPESVTNPLDYIKTNTAGTLSVLEAAKATNVRKIVFSSTAAVYGDVKIASVSETDPVAPINPYGFSKACAEGILKYTAEAHDIQYVILRYFNVAGASVKGKNGQRGKDVSQLIHKATQAALGKISHLEIFGQDYDTLDGTCVRDYIHVDDLALAHLAALDYLAINRDSQIFNVGYGIGYSVNQVVETMKSVSKFDFACVLSHRRPGDPAKVISNNEKILRLTNWRPVHQDLRLICQTSFDWLKNLSAVHI